MRQLYSRWRSRHRNAANLYLHMVGLPTCLLAAPAMAALGQWLAAAALFVSGYCLQIIGHLVEGTRSGDGVFFSRLPDWLRSAQVWTSPGRRGKQEP